MRTLLFLCLLFICCQLIAKNLYVDNLKGVDTNPGTAELPFKSYTKALKVFKGGDIMHLVHNENHPYRGRLYLIRCDGTAENRTVLDGHGALFDGRTPFPASAWKNEGSGVFSKELKNNAHVMDHRLGCWSGDFPIVFFDGKDGVNCRKREELKPFSYFLLKIPMKKGQKKRDPLHNTLYIKLPEGKTPDDIKVETLVDSIGVGVESDYVTVKNIRVQYTGGDCFDTVWKKNIIFDNVEGSYAMDQGISHHGSEVLVKNSKFHHNAGCGIVDVNMGKSPCKTTYINCLIENNNYRGGVELLGTEHVLEKCVVRGNGPSKALAVNRQAKAVVRDCVFSGIPGKSKVGISIGSKTELEIENSTIKDFQEAFTPPTWKTTRKVKSVNNQIINCGRK